MKKIIVLMTILAGFIANAQDKIVDKNGKATFEASVASFEEVKATNSTVTFVMNTKTGEVASLALMKGFRFKTALMEEHFNENYIESDKYPKATFKGKIDGFDASALTATPKDYVIKGTLEMHGKTVAVTAPAKIRKTDAGIEVVSNFTVNASDFDIAIPSVVKSKVSNKVSIKTSFTAK